MPRTVGELCRIDAEQAGPLGGFPRHQHIRVAQLTDIGRPQQGHERAHVIGPRAQLASQPIGPILDQGSQEMARDADGASSQRERTHDVQRSAHPPGCEHRQAGGFVPPQRIQ